ncbi:hypothetical protein ACICHK_22145 [Streptomyces sp. AHU1]|uniref:hypothetical protein n=1 Tax=Streptomyces sp. AHU1 TaxID=3377215 RepID=UPI003878253C
MPRGRHRHSPPLHRVLPSSAIAGVSLVFAIGPWLFTDAFALRVLAAGAAATAVVSAVVLRRWDSAAGKRVADLTRARASDEWRHEERVAELETDLEESRELRVKLEQKLRAKRTELAGLRNEHAALLRRYATAETERATALEGRRQLAIEASVPARALPAARTAPDELENHDSHDESSGTPGSSDSTDTTDPSGAVDSPDMPGTAETSGGPDGSGTHEETAESVSGSGTDAIEAFMAPDDDAFPDGDDDTASSSSDDEDDEDEDAKAEADAGTGESSEVFSPAGSSLFLRAGAALSRTTGAAGQPEGTEARTASTSVALALPDADHDADPDPDDAVPAAAPDADPVQAPATGSARSRSLSPNDVPPRGESALDAAVRRDAAAKKRAAMQKGAAATKELVAARDLAAERDAAANGEAATKGAPAAGTGPSSDSAAEAGGAQGKPEAAREHERAVAEAEPSPAAPETSRRAVAAPPARAALPPAKPAQRSGHFTVPTAVAVVPHTAPVRRPSAEGGFDFFGTQKEAADDAAMEAVQNEDLADVVGQEALAAHEAESGGETPDGADRQVIDLTEHDETEHIDMTGLRSAAS